MRPSSHPHSRVCISVMIRFGPALQGSSKQGTFSCPGWGKEPPYLLGEFFALTCQAHGQRGDFCTPEQKLGALQITGTALPSLYDFLRKHREDQAALGEGRVIRSGEHHAQRVTYPCPSGPATLIFPSHVSGEAEGSGREWGGHDSRCRWGVG